MKAKETILKTNTKTQFYVLKKNKWIKSDLKKNYLGSQWVRLDGQKRIAIIDKESKIEMYLSWWNNFVSTDRFAEHYQISESVAIKIINEGRKYFN